MRRIYVLTHNGLVINAYTTFALAAKSRKNLADTLGESVFDEAFHIQPADLKEEPETYEKRI